MSAIKGRAVKVTRNGVLVAGARTKSIKINGSVIDVTTDDDDAVRQLLDQPGQVDVTISVAGILTNDLLLQESLRTDDRTQTTIFSMAGGFVGSPNALTLTGNFFLSSFEIGAEYQQGATFTAEFQSAGAVTMS